jgi:hypothetical protein
MWQPFSGNAERDLEGILKVEVINNQQRVNNNFTTTGDNSSTNSSNRSNTTVAATTTTGARDADASRAPGMFFFICVFIYSTNEYLHRLRVWVCFLFFVFVFYFILLTDIIDYVYGRHWQMMTD